LPLSLLRPAQLSSGVRSASCGFDAQPGFEAQDRANAVVLRFGEQVAVSTPRDPERFVVAVRS
jgi:hypothetical protein